MDAALGARRSFPRAVADLDAACLSAVLGKEVESVTVLDGADGTSTRARLWLTGPDVPIYPGDILFVPRTTIAEINLWIELFIERVLPFERSFQYSLNRNQNSRF